jgi:hypothetical protein
MVLSHLEERAEREECERQERLAPERMEKLLQDAESLQKAETIRSYVENVRALAPQRGHDPALIDRWAAWALQIADGIDPVRTQFAHSPEGQPESPTPFIASQG